MLCARVVAIRETPDLELFIRLFLVLVGLGLLLALAVYPLVLRLFGLRQKPFAWMKQTLTPVFIGLCSGNNYLPLAAQMKNGLDGLHYHRRIWGWFFPLASITGRAGTALVTSASFFLVLRSYSSLEVTILQFVFVVVASVIISLIMGSIPNGRVLIGLALLSSWFGQGLEEGYLILQPVAPILISLAVVIDVLNQAFIAHLLASLARKENKGVEREHSSKLQDEFNIS
jgi:Na+/H+-dicarboxylate symporter